MNSRPNFRWQLGSRTLELGQRTLVMGIINVTPDSFSDGGKFFGGGSGVVHHHHAVNHALQLLDEGADILDIGGESTRPGKKEKVSAQEEQDRVLPVIEGIRKAVPKACISIDTYKASTAVAAVDAGAEIVNDISALQWDPSMAGACARLRCGVILMHTRGTPEEWRTLPRMEGRALVALVGRELQAAAKRAIAAGIPAGHIVLDPGFGFGKNFEENYPLLAQLWDLHAVGFPLLSGTSRKSFIGRTLGHAGEDAPPDHRLHGSLATVVTSVLQGAHIVRVHDVKPAVEACKIADAIVATNRP